MNEDQSKGDFRLWDRPEVIRCLFHPRPDSGIDTTMGAAEKLNIPVAPEVFIGARCFPAAPFAPTLLFFHGNGEIVSDYDSVGAVFSQLGIRFFPVDYRGYGWSTGTPSVSAMMRDCHAILDFVKTYLSDRGRSGPLIPMGRSLGSASVLELAHHRSEEIDGLIIESGFAYALPLLRLIGVDTEGLGLTESTGFRNIDKIRRWTKPTLIIHAEWDQIIPLSDAKALYDACSAADTQLLPIPMANHNDIFFRGYNQYLSAVKAFTDRVLQG